MAASLRHVLKGTDFHRCIERILHKSYTNSLTKQVTQKRCIHNSLRSHCSNYKSLLRRNTQDIHNPMLRVSASHVYIIQRFNTTDSENSEYIQNSFPPAPEGLVMEDDNVTEIAQSLAQAAEPTLSSLGLCNPTPAGAVQAILEVLHVDCGLPWFGAVLVGTIALRTMLIPLVLESQRNAAKSQKYMPLMQQASDKFKAGQAANDNDLKQEAYEEMMEIRKHFNPFASMWTTVAQMSVAVSVFTGLRGMAYLPVESLKTGGFLWITDLTVPDPYMVLPAVIAIIPYFTMELVFMEMGISSDQKAGSAVLKKVMKVMPFITFPFIASMPSVMGIYWLTGNVCSFALLAILQTPQGKALVGKDKEKL